ncbi:PepSY domain-containing protein [Xanthomonas translucens pv. graminis]|uniref:PepSY-associated TM helix domain-containing protein n=1 Tax=Xanthomonas graminis TaxID=3390026 RepID=UPI0025423F71|nr:PepSY-associated TM helix domain-containing protein [Xanthomonas translucens]WIH05034.1 PepSY domain-containing protein [Xanthomonas translucens pv. graminis]
MKAASLRQFLSAHSWMGLFAGMALFIAFYVGAITVFTHELGGWPRRAAAVAPPAQATEQAAQALADAVLARYPALAESFTLTLPDEHGAPPRLYAFGPPAQPFGGTVQFQPGADGQPLPLPQRSGFVGFLYDLHFTGGLPRTLCTYLSGVVCIFYGLALVSGVVLYAPVFLKGLFALRAGRNVKRLWQDARNVIGMLSLPFHAIFAWSGAVLALGVLLPAHIKAPLLPVADLLARARAASPGFAPDSLSFHDAGDANARVEIYGQPPQRRLNTLAGVAMEAATGKVLRVLAPQTMAPGVASLRGLQALHYANFGGAPLRWLYFLLGLGGAFLFYTGNLLWVEARRKRRQQAQPWRTHAMARLTVGLCLGCVAGVSALFVAARLLPPGQERVVYYAVFGLGVAWALLRPTARGAYELLLACAVLNALVPLAALRGADGWVAPWSSTLLLAVDGCALALAWAYWQMARATHRRGRNGDPNSVWALPAKT